MAARPSTPTDMLVSYAIIAAAAVAGWFGAGLWVFFGLCGTLAVFLYPTQGYLHGDMEMQATLRPWRWPVFIGTVAGLVGVGYGLGWGLGWLFGRVIG
jgi:hypothetical protein